MIKNKSDLNNLLRAEFKAFVRKVFNELYGNGKYKDNWHIDLLCFYMEVLFGGFDNRIIINLPPRHLKSMICSIAFPAWILGKNPKASIICISHSQELADTSALNCKRIMETTWYKEVFPATRISKHKSMISDFETTRGGGRLSTSMNGTLTGRGADFIIIDDPIKSQDAFSDTIREKTNELYANSIYSRLNDKNDGRILVLMQRFHEDDFTGYLLETDKSFQHIAIPAIAERDEEWSFNRVLGMGAKRVTRKAGEALHPERESLAQLLKTKATIGSINFAAQYQQSPMAIEGNIIKKEWLKYYSPSEFWSSVKRGEMGIQRILMSWDTASKGGLENDYSVCLSIAEAQNGKRYVFDVYREKLDLPILMRKVKELYQRMQESHPGILVEILIEEKGSGIGLVQFLKEECRLADYVLSFIPETDKITRLHCVSHLIENGTCLFPDDKPQWWNSFYKELLSFPRARYDDQCDALSQALSAPGSVNVDYGSFFEGLEEDEYLVTAGDINKLEY